MRNRGERRAVTRAKALRQARIAAEVRRSSYQWGVPVPEPRPAGHWRKVHALDCGCRKASRGCPKLVYGSCLDAVRGRQPAVAARIEGHRLCARWLREGEPCKARMR